MRLLLSVSALIGFQACRFGFEILPQESSGMGMGGAMGGQTSAGGDGDSSNSGSGGQEASCPGWWDDRFSRRRHLTFDNSEADEALDRFTTLVVLTSQNFDYRLSAPEGADIVFVDGDTGAQLPHQIDLWNEGALSSIWVQVPNIEATSGTDSVWMYYGGSDQAAESSAAVFDSLYRGVWHLGELSGALKDSTSNDIDLSWVGGGAGSQGAAGRIAVALDLDGVLDGANSSGGELDNLTDHTLTMWVRPDDAGGGHDRQTIFSAAAESGAPYAGPSLVLDRDSQQVGAWIDGSYHFSSDPANQLLLGEWAFVALRADTNSTGGSVEVRVNGADFETIYAGDASSAASVSGSRIQIGNSLSVANAQFFGRIDEVQLSSGLRSDTWVDSQYRCQANLGFVTVEREEACAN